MIDLRMLRRNKKSSMARESIPSAGGCLMERVKDYNDLDRLEKTEGREVLVLFANLIHRVIGGKWEAVGKVTSDGKVIYRR